MPGHNHLKVPYEVLALEIDKLYPPHYDLKQDETLEDHLEYIHTFIESCGWTVEEYMEEYIHRGLDGLFPDPSKQN